MIEFLAFGWKISVLYLGIFIYFTILAIMYSSIISDNNIINKIVWKAFLFLSAFLIAFPAFFFIHYYSQEGFSPYLYYIEHFIIIWNDFISYWQWVIVIMLIPMLCRGAFYNYAEIAVDLNVNRLKDEIKRWLSTPYISPLMYSYLMNPPEPLLWNRFDKTNRLYHLAADTLRENIYKKIELKFKKPIEKPSIWFRLIPSKAWYKLCVNTTILAGLSYYLVNNNHPTPFYDGYKYFVPILCGLAARIILIGFSIMNHASWGNTQRMLKRNDEAKESLITWGDLHGDQPMALQVIDAWQNVYESMRKKTTGYNPVIPMPELPYSSIEIPVWVDEHRSNIQRFINRKSKQDTTVSVKERSISNVVQFKNKK